MKENDRKIIRIAQYALENGDWAILFKLATLFEKRAGFEMKASELLESIKQK